MRQTERERSAFADLIAQHMDAAYNLARWLITDEQDAADVLQEACMRAMKGYPSYRGGNDRAWLLTIVRNTAYNHLRDTKRSREILFDEASLEDFASDAENPEMRVIREFDVGELRRAIEQLPTEYREAIVLREIEGMSYKEIAALQQVAIGTVMSRLSRARVLLRQSLLRSEVAL